MSRAAMFRFARSEITFLKELKTEVLSWLQDSQTLLGAGLGRLPHAGIEDPPVLEVLLEALSFGGQFARYESLVKASPEHVWALDPDGLLPPHAVGKVQGTLFRMFRQSEMCRDFPKAISQKLSVTLGPALSSSLVVPVDWVLLLCKVLPLVQQHTAISIFKTLIGGWTTSARMHEAESLPCLFGCAGERGEINHDPLCSPLWQIAAEVLKVESPIELGSRLCVVDPSPERARLLALVFQLYHHAKTRTKEMGGFTSVGSRHVQRMAFEAARTFVHRF